MFGFFKKKEVYSSEGQTARIRRIMNDGKWHTLKEISKKTRDPEPSVSARIRDLRKPGNGSYVVEKRRVNGGKTGPFEYRLVLKGNI